MRACLDHAINQLKAWHHEYAVFLVICTLGSKYQRLHMSPQLTVTFVCPEESIREWQERNEDWLKDRLNDQFVTRIQGVFQTLPPLSAATWLWASRYLLVHSLAHILVNQFVFERMPHI